MLVRHVALPEGAPNASLQLPGRGAAVTRSAGSSGWMPRVHRNARRGIEFPATAMP
jgi:hypothetical protein